MRVDSRKFTLEIDCLPSSSPCPSLVKRLTQTHDIGKLYNSGQRWMAAVNTPNAWRHHQRAVFWHQRRRSGRLVRKSEAEAVNPTKSIMLVAIVALSSVIIPPTKQSILLPVWPDSLDSGLCPIAHWIEVGACVANRYWTDVLLVALFPDENVALHAYDYSLPWWGCTAMDG